MSAGNTTVAITPGSGATVAVYGDANAQLFQRVLAAPEGSEKSTYWATYVAQSAGTGATTNLFTMAGSATKTVKLVKLFVSATCTTAAAIFDVLMTRQSAVDTGGTAATAA